MSEYRLKRAIRFDTKEFPFPKWVPCILVKKNKLPDGVANLEFKNGLYVLNPSSKFGELIKTEEFNKCFDVWLKYVWDNEFKEAVYFSFPWEMDMKALSTKTDKEIADELYKNSIAKSVKVDKVDNVPLKNEDCNWVYFYRELYSRIENFHGDIEVATKIINAYCNTSIVTIDADEIMELFNMKNQHSMRRRRIAELLKVVFDVDASVPEVWWVIPEWEIIKKELKEGLYADFAKKAYKSKLKKFTNGIQEVFLDSDFKLINEYDKSVENDIKNYTVYREKDFGEKHIMYYSCLLSTKNYDESKAFSITPDEKSKDKLIVDISEYEKPDEMYPDYNEMMGHHLIEINVNVEEKVN